MMTKNILVDLKNVEKYISNYDHMILSIDLDDAWWMNALNDSTAYKIKSNIQTLALKPFITSVVISTKPSNMLFKEFGLRELLYAGNHGLDILYHGSQAVNHDSLGKHGVIAGFYHEIDSLVSSYQGLSITKKNYSVQIGLRGGTSVFPEKFLIEIRKILAGYPNISMIHSRKILEFTIAGIFQKAAIHSRIQKFLGKSNTLELYIGNHFISHRKIAENCDMLAVSLNRAMPSYSDYHLDDMEDLRIFLNWLNESDCVNYFVPGYLKCQLN